MIILSLFSAIIGSGSPSLYPGLVKCIIVSHYRVILARIYSSISILPYSFFMEVEKS